MGDRRANMKSFASCVVVAICLGAVAAEVYFEEDFSGDWESRWVQSEHKDDLGKFVAAAGVNGDASNKGLKTFQDAKFYGISAPMKEFSNKDKPLVVQYSVKHEQGIDCGGAYLKLGGSPFDGKKFHGETPYNIMFGPDICGMTKRTHLIFNYKEKNLLKDKDMCTESDELTHIYTLVVKPDGTFAVSIDGSEVESGKLVDGWKFLEPKEIDDPEDKKPSDWVDEAEMDDPEDKKLDGYDDIPAKIADPKATKPDDWDDESDGEWEAPQIDNPDYKGEWKAKKIKNPAYKGPYVRPEIDNPDYVEEKDISKYDDIGGIGIELWQVKAGTVFDNIIVTDSEAEADAFLKETCADYKCGEAEKKVKDDQDAEAEKARKAAEEAAKKEEDAKKEKEDGE